MAYGFWNIFVMINGLYSGIAYPYFTVNNFPYYGSASFQVIIFSEAMFFLDILLCFFKQELDEEGNSKFDSLTKVSTKYI